MNILLINSVPSFYAAVSKSLAKTKAAIFKNENIEEAVSDIQRHGINIVCVNWSRGDFDLVSLCHNIRKIKSPRYIYCLVVTSREREGDIPKCMAAGADDVIFKPFGMNELKARIGIAARVARLEEESTRNKKRILRLAKEDPVTGLLNRRALLDEAVKEMGRAAREMKHVAVLIANVSNFKDLADRHGIETMDGLFEECGRRIRNTCRTYDKIGRYGMTSFMIFIPDSRKGNGEKVAQRILQAAVKRPYLCSNEKISIVMSVGVSELDPKDISKNKSANRALLNDVVLDSLLRKAEIAARRAEKAGRNRVEIYSE